MKPNLYKIVHKKYVGDNHAGALMDVISYVDTLKQAKQFRNSIVSITPIKAKYQEEMSSSDIEFFFERVDSEQEEQRKADKIKSLKKRLQELENE